MPILKKRKTSLLIRKIENSKRNGWRHAVFGTTNNPKSKYMGQWKNDKKEGIGLEISRNNLLYRGNWLNGMKHGFGDLNKMRKNDHPQKIYTGYWCQGTKHGFGIYWYTDGFYKGDFFKNKRHGFGKMWWNDGRYYEGAWKNDLFYGIGTLLSSKGNEYHGQFVNGKKEGNGIFYHKNTGQVQHGFWNADMCISSTLEDSCFRQFAINPTSYPIP